MKTKFFVNGFWSLLNQGIRVGSIALIMILLSRHFGPQRFGSLAVGFALVRIFAVVATFGLDRIVVRHLVEQSDSRADILRQAFCLKLGIACASYLALIGFVFVFQRDDALLLRIVASAGGGLFFQAFDVYDYGFQANGRFGFSFLGRSLPILLSAGIKLGAILIGAPLIIFAVLETIESAFIAMALYLINRRIPNARTTLRPKIFWPRFLAEGVPLLLSALAVMIYMRSDAILLGKMIGYEAAGVYAAAAQISETCALLPVALMPALFPLLVRWRRSGSEFYLRKVERLFLFAVLGGLVFSIFLTIGAPVITDFIFGPSYHTAAGILAVHGWTLVFIFIGIAQSGYDVTEHLTWIATSRMVVGAVLNIALNLFLIPRFGAIGSAIATLVAQIFSAVLLNALHPATRPILRMQVGAILIWPALRALARDRQSSENRAWLPA